MDARSNGPEVALDGATTPAGHDRTSMTYRLECWRAISSGLIEAAAGTFLLLIAIRQFGAGSTAKALVAGGGGVGFLLAPWVVSLVAQRRMPTARAASLMAAIGAMTLLLMAAVPWLPVFVIGSVVAITAYTAAFPLLTQIYQENYPAERRGRIYGTTLIIRLTTTVIACELGGRLIDQHIERSQILLLFFAIAFAATSCWLAKYPSSTLTCTDSQRPAQILTLVLKDRFFRQTMMSWFLMGFANLLVLPLRIEHLSNPAHGQPFTTVEIAFLVGVVPTAGRLLTMPLWGVLFDRVNFLKLRIFLNAGLAVGIYVFFASDNYLGLVAGSLIHGMASGGGDVSWGLWVTKFAPAQRVADYMSVHTFFSGIRGLIAPLLGFHLLAVFTPEQVATACAVLILFANIPLVREGKVTKSLQITTPQTSPPCG